MHPFRGQAKADQSSKMKAMLGDDAKCRASGGRVKSGKAKTHINIMIAPQGGQDKGAPPPPVPMMAPPPSPPPGPPPGAGGPPRPPMPMPGGAPGGMPNMANAMPMRKAGGRVRKRETGGSVKAEGMKAGTQVQHTPGKSDSGKTDEPLYSKPPLLTRKDGGKVSDKYPDMEFGAGSGEGRKEKTAMQKKTYP